MMKMKTTDDLGKINTLLTNCNRNFVTRPFSLQKNAQTAGVLLGPDSREK